MLWVDPFFFDFECTRFRSWESPAFFNPLRGQTGGSTPGWLVLVCLLARREQHADSVKITQRLLRGHAST